MKLLQGCGAEGRFLPGKPKVKGRQNPDAVCESRRRLAVEMVFEHADSGGGQAESELRGQR
jgi:hypothetical protein